MTDTHNRLSGRRAIATVLLSLSLLLANSSVIAEPIKVAFTGDQGVGPNAEAVLSLIASEGTDLLMIQGDLGYNENTAGIWNSQINSTLGENFPVLVVVGNHENFEWLAYQSYAQRRINRNSALSCSGNTGVKAFCQFGNLDIVQVSPGIHEVAGVPADDGYADYIRSSLDPSQERWRICAWHKNQRNLQTGSKGNSTGWGVYDACLDAGAMVAVAHEHAYSRTYLLSDFENQTVVHRNSDMTLQPGQSFVFVSGLGGREVRPQKHGGDWWASVYTASQDAKHGALFCTFDDAAADCYFKAIDGSIPDRFSLRRGSQPISQVANNNSTENVSTGSGYVFSRSDKKEFRWIAQNANGQMGNIWIDAACAQSLGGVVSWGRWSDLDEIAPLHDSIANPCRGEPVQTAQSTNDGGEGYVYSRTDKNELRWIDVNSSGGMGSVWIDSACAESLGGVSASGDWGQLMSLAPGMDTIAYPCI